MTEAYRFWAPRYDVDEPNIMMRLGDELLRRALEDLDLGGKDVLDIGCGTGRNWRFIESHRPRRLVGVDISAPMLARLKKKHPSAELLQGDGADPRALTRADFDVLLSTLALGYMPDARSVLHAWRRVLRPDARLVVVTVHPEALDAGVRRTCSHRGQTFDIRHFHHPREQVEAALTSAGFVDVHTDTVRVDERVRDLYAAQNSLHVYESIRGTPMVIAYKGRLPG